MAKIKFNRKHFKNRPQQVSYSTSLTTVVDDKELLDNKHKRVKFISTHDINKATSQVFGLSEQETNRLLRKTTQTIRELLLNGNSVVIGNDLFIGNSHSPVVYNSHLAKLISQDTLHSYSFVEQFLLEISNYIRYNIMKGQTFQLYGVGLLRLSDNNCLTFKKTKRLSNSGRLEARMLYGR